MTVILFWPQCDDEFGNSHVHIYVACKPSAATRWYGCGLGECLEVWASAAVGGVSTGSCSVLIPWTPAMSANIVFRFGIRTWISNYITPWDVNYLFCYDIDEIFWPQPIRSLKLGHVTGQGSMSPTWVGRVSDRGKMGLHKKYKNLDNIAVYLIASLKSKWKNKQIKNMNNWIW